MSLLRVCLPLLLATVATLAADTAPTPRVGAGTEYDGITVDTATSVSASELPAQLTLDAATVRKPLSKDLLGLALSGRECDDLFMNTTSTQVTDEMRGLLPRLPLHLVRIVQYNDASILGADWKKAIGPQTERQPIRFNAWEKPLPNTAGPIELVNAMQAADPAMRVVWTVDVRADDQADLARFLTKPVESGDPWAAKRAATGRVAPVPVVLWELGNEVEWTSKEHALSLEAYVAACRKSIAAIRSVVPDARFAPHLATAPWAWQDRFHQDWRTWHRTLLKEFGADIDHLAFHPYYFGYPTSIVESYMDVVRDDIKEITGDSRITLYISEHGLWPTQTKGVEWRTTWWTTHGIPGCLATAQFLNRVAQRPDVGPVTYHNLSAGPWGLVYRGKETGKLFTTGIADLFALYGATLGDQVIATNLTGAQTDPHNADCSLTCLATRTADGLGLVLVNRLPTTRRTIALTTTGATYDLVSATTLTAASDTARNTEFEQQILVSTSTTAVPGITSYDLPPRSVVGLRLRQH
jgi:hypothetical protein